MKYKRPSTLPTDLASRPLASFTSPSNGTSASLVSGELWNVTYDDTTSAGIVTTTDSLWTNQSQYATLIQDSTDPTRLMNGNFFFYNTSDSVLTDAVGVTVFVPVDTMIMEFNVYGSDWNAVTSYMGGTYGYLIAGGRLRDEDLSKRIVSESTGTPLTQAALAMMMAEEEDPGPCDTYESVAKYWTGAAAVASGWAAVQCRGLKRLSPTCWSTAGVASVITTTAGVATTNYLICLGSNNQALRAPEGYENDSD